MSFTLTSHDIRRAPSAEQRATSLHRRITQEAFGWPQAWSLWQNVPMTPWGYPLSAAPFARGASGTPTDRQFGRDIPLYWNEVDLRGFRVLSKFLTDTNQFGIGFKNRLVDYHVRKGFGWQACRKGHKKTAYPTVATDDPVVQRGQEVLDAFRDKVKWPLVSREAFERLHVDGEVFARFGIYNGRAWFRFIGADQVGNPSGDVTSPQSFGIETDPDDIEDVWAYHVWDVPDYPSGGEWIDASDVIHVKANVRSDMKRGLPSFFPVQDNLDVVRKLLSNMLGSAQKMAAVAWREKFPTASAQQVQQLIPTTAAIDQTGMGPGPFGLPGFPGWTGGVNGFQQGEVIKVEGNREFEEGPTAAGVTNFIEAEQAALRGAAVRFGFPESLATGKIDDINFAAALTTGAPFAVAIEGGQFEYGCRWERECALKVYNLAYRMGALSADDLRQLDVEITEPAPMIAEPDKETDRRVELVKARILSPQTAQLQEQLDPQHEQANWDEWDKANPPQPLPVDPNVDPKQLTNEAKDASGHEHIASGPKGGQFTGSGQGGSSKTGKAGNSEPNDDGDSEKWSEELYYHGTNEDFESFDDVQEHGISFTDNKHHSHEFGGTLYEVRLNIKNPLDLTHLGSGAGEEGEQDERVSTDQIRATLSEVGIKIQFGRFRKGWTTDLLRSVMPEVIKQARALGYDALRVEDFKEFEATETVVFDPKQIKVIAKRLAE